MIRVFQMVLAQVLSQALLTRKWRRPTRRHIISLPSIKNYDSIELKHHWLSHENFESQGLTNLDILYPWCLIQIIEYFLDKSSARFSIHQIVTTGHKLLSLQPGSWFGPTSCSIAITHLINGPLNYITQTKPPKLKPLLSNLLKNESKYSRQDDTLFWIGPSHNRRVLRAYHSDGGVINLPEIRKIFLEYHVAVDLVMYMSLRLGLDSFNLIYKRFLQSCFAMSHFQGIAG